MKFNFSSHLILLRPINFIITFSTVFIAAAICSNGDFNFSIVVIAAFAASLTAASGNIINDYFDAEPDKINHASRPIPSGKISKKNALIFYFAAVLVSIILAFQLTPAAFRIVLFSHALLFLYSYSLKKKILIGNFIIAFLTGFVFIFGGLAAGNIKLAIIPAVFGFLINLVREFVKDMEDVKGDLSFGAASIASKYGIKVSKHFAAFFSIVLIFATVYPFLISFYKIEYFIIVMAVVNTLMVYFIKSLYENDSKQNLNKLSNILKLNMVFGLIAIYLGR